MSVSIRETLTACHNNIHRFSKVFRTIEPTLHNVCEFWFNKDRSRIREIRPDTLAQMMSLAGVRPGGRYLVVEEASGLLVSAVLERLGGELRVVQDSLGSDLHRRRENNHGL